MSRRELRTEVWRQAYGEDQTIDVHLSWLRRKLGETAASPRYLVAAATLLPLIPLAPAGPAFAHGTVGVGVHPARAARGRSVTVSAVCSGGRVRSVASTAFTRRVTAAPARSAAWYPTFTVSPRARAGGHAVQVRCADGSVATTVLAVTGARAAR